MNCRAVVPPVPLAPPWVGVDDHVAGCRQYLEFMKEPAAILFMGASMHLDPWRG